MSKGNIPSTVLLVSEPIESGNHIHPSIATCRRALGLIRDAWKNHSPEHPFWLHEPVVQIDERVYSSMAFFSLMQVMRHHLNRHQKSTIVRKQNKHLLNHTENSVDSVDSTINCRAEQNHCNPSSDSIVNHSTGVDNDEPSDTCHQNKTTTKESFSCVLNNKTTETDAKKPRRGRRKKTDTPLPCNTPPTGKRRGRKKKQENSSTISSIISHASEQQRQQHFSCQETPTPPVTTNDSFVNQQHDDISIDINSSTASSTPSLTFESTLPDSLSIVIKGPEKIPKNGKKMGKMKQTKTNTCM